MQHFVASIGFANKIFGGLCLISILCLIRECTVLISGRRQHLSATILVSLYKDAKMVSNIVAQDAAHYACSCCIGDQAPALSVAREYFLANIAEVILSVICRVEEISDMDIWLDALLQRQLSFVSADYCIHESYRSNTDTDSVFSTS